MSKCTRIGYETGECSCERCVKLDTERETMGRELYEVGDIKYSSVTQDGAAAYQIIKINEKRFKLHSNMSKSGCLGFDSDMCAKIVLSDGRIENLFDARSVGGFPNGSYCGSKDMAKEHVERCFKVMREHLKELYL